MKEKIKLKNVTLLGIDCINIERIQKAINISQEEIEFAEIKLLSSIQNKDPRWVEIDPISTIEDFSKFCIQELVNYVDTEYVLLVQHDGFILNPQSWSNDFLKYDYIGAPWYIKEDFWFDDFDIPRSLENTHVVGNGGFCLRSRKFLETSALLASNDKFKKYHPEDLVMCVYDNNLLLEKGMKFAPYDVAKIFAIEGADEVYSNQFGFNGYKWTDISKWIKENPHHKIKNQFIG